MTQPMCWRCLATGLDGAESTVNKLKSLRILRILANKKDSEDLFFDDEGI